jgi:GTP pyrophosphokinase
MISLPQGSNVIDFAYAIHPDVGNRMNGAKVGGNIVSLNYELSTSEIVEILISPDINRQPNRQWLDICKTKHAKSVIRKWFRTNERPQNIEVGKKAFTAELERSHIRLPEEKYPLLMADTMKKHNCNTIEDFYAVVGYGGIILQNLSQAIREKYKTDFPEYDEKIIPENTDDVIQNLAEHLTEGVYKPGEEIIVDGKNGIHVKFAQCCNPLPGDDIIGFITKGHGLSVHRKDCEHYVKSAEENIDPKRWIPVAWPTDAAKNAAATFKVTLDIVAQPGDHLIVNIFQILDDNRVTLNNTVNKTFPNGNKNIICSINTTGRKQIEGVIRELNKIPNIMSVERKQD